MSRRTPPSTDNPINVDGDEWSILRDMVPYLWPEGHPGLKARVVFALVALVPKTLVAMIFGKASSPAHAPNLESGQ